MCEKENRFQRHGHHLPRIIGHISVASQLSSSQLRCHIEVENVAWWLIHLISSGCVPQSWILACCSESG